jgi:hypothetical protein
LGDAVFPVNLICMNADMLPEFAAQAGEPFFAERYSIGLWFWEVARFPERWLDSFSLLEEVWAPTAHVAATLEKVATVPVTTVRIPVLAPAVAGGSRSSLGLPEGFAFLFSFDYLSVFERKNPLGVIEAFARAFAPGEGAKLVIKCINHDRDPTSHAELLQAVGDHADVQLVDRYLSPADNLRLTALADCYVSLHRAEGFGLGMAEAMSLGKPVIATGYSGNLDFMTASNSLLVHHQLVPIGAGAEPYPPDGVWADPDLGHAAKLMRQVFDDREAARELGARAAGDIRRTHSPAAAGAIMHRRLESIRATGDVRQARIAARTHPPALARLPMRVGQGPRAAGKGRPQRARKIVREVLLRLMRPFTQYQQGVNNQLVEALEELSLELDQQRRAAAEERAQLLAELRARERPHEPR